MWKLDHEESWAPKNWCFWTVVLEKAPESPLDCKDIQPVHPKGNQSWIFIGRTDIEAETPILWPRDLNWLLGKDAEFSSVAQSCLTFCDPMYRSTPGLSAHYQLLESIQTHVHWVGDAIQTSHLLLSPSPPALNLSQNQILQMNQHFAAGCQSIGVSASPSVLPKNTQDWYPLEWTGWISLESKGFSRIFSNTTVQKHQFFCAKLSL